MTIANAGTTPSSVWSRFWRRLAQIEENMSLGYEVWQDQRIASVETELRSLKQEMADLRKEKDSSSVD